MESGKIYQRREDMSPNGNLALSISEIGDVTVAIVGRDQVTRRYTRTGVTFCTCTNGGGLSLHTRRTLIELAEAVEKDNKETPDPRGDVCARCNGEGYAGRGQFRRLCGDCGGDGKIDAGGFHSVQDCPTCGGWGFKGTQPTGRPLNEPQSERRPCPRCNGTGKAPENEVEG